MVEKLIEIRWHGRGGQGAVTSAELIAQAAISENKYAQAFPSFGPERRGAPVLAFNRVDRESPIRIRAEVTQPDVVVVLDPGLLAIIKVTAGLKEKGFVIINTKKSAAQIRADFGITARIGTLDATKIAKEVLGVPIVNTTMIGALLKATELINMESLKEPLAHRFGKLAQRNFDAMKRAYQETVVEEQR
ncbi:MAG: 2-oxoacid:acceptor oxidoreductase family protein [Dehalococcoidales bacterium]|nr:2-oxoacid:acceptor oxidoreductase family protein [Dehalococcoidales bacterium]